MTHSNHQALTLQAVQEAAETLMLLHQQTTTLDVKNYLRKNNYMALQRDVSQFMSTLSQQQHAWKAKDNGRYKIYSFGQDSKETFQEYLEKGTDFWEIEVGKTQQITTLGKIGTDGGSYTTTLPSNRHAIQQAKILVQQKINSGYIKAIDQRLPKALRSRYKKWFQQKIEQCTLAFYGIEKIEKQSANFLFKQQLTQGYLLISKSAGYEISFYNNQQSISKCLDLLDKTSWDATQIDANSLYLTGEKTTHKTAFSIQGQTQKDFTIKNLIGVPKIQQLLIHRDHLYQIRLTFEGQKTVTLSKFELDLDKELLPLVKAFLKT